MKNSFTIIANWKANPTSVHEAGRLAHASDGIADIIVPPAPFLDRVAAEIRLSELGSQDVSSVGGTGSVSGKMLTSVGVSCVIIGHSERRLLGDTDAVVSKKVRSALEAKLKVILCVGEPKSVHRGGLAAIRKFIGAELTASLAGTAKLFRSRAELFVAYEPIWAIGSGRAEDPARVGEVLRSVSEVVARTLPQVTLRTLYGGSVLPENAGALGNVPTASGFLIGGASLNPTKLKLIRKSVSNRYEENR